MRAVLLAAPLAFVLGLLLGLAASSAWRIVRRSDYDRWRRNGSEPAEPPTNVRLVEDDEQ
jgi:hypothetical protein